MHLETKMQEKVAIICSKLIINHCLHFLNNMFYSYGRLQIQKCSLNCFPHLKRRAEEHSGYILERSVFSLFYLSLFNLDLRLVLQLFSWTSNRQKHRMTPPPPPLPPSPPLPPTPPLTHTLSSLPHSSPVFRCLTPRALELRHDSKDGVVATDARPDLLVVLLGVADLVELRLCEHADPDENRWALPITSLFTFPAGTISSSLKRGKNPTQTFTNVFPSNPLKEKIQDIPVSFGCISGWSSAAVSFEILTVDANIDPPNHTAYLCMWWVMTCTSIGLGWEKQAVSYTSFEKGRRDQILKGITWWISIRD